MSVALYYTCAFKVEAVAPIYQITLEVESLIYDRVDSKKLVI